MKLCYPPRAGCDPREGAAADTSAGPPDPGAEATVCILGLSREVVNFCERSPRPSAGQDLTAADREARANEIDAIVELLGYVARDVARHDSAAADYVRFAQLRLRWCVSQAAEEPSAKDEENGRGVTNAG